MKSKFGIGFNPFVNASHTDAERHYFGKDHLGSVRAVTNQWGSPLYMFDYDVFGTPLQDRPERFRHGFTGKEYDSWTGLYNYGFRDYSAMFGRFTSVDPIQDGHNWYAYVNSDPVSWLDPWGLCPQDAESGEDVKTVTLYQEEYGWYSANPNVVTGGNLGEVLTPKDLVTDDPVIVNILVVLKPADVNKNGAVKGELTVFFDSVNNAFGKYGVPMDSFPVVAGGPNDAPTPAASYNSLRPELTSTSSNDLLKDDAHGGENNIMIRLPGTGGNAIHQGNNEATIDSAYTEGCIAITGYAVDETRQNYEAYKALVQAKNNKGGTVNVTIVYESSE